MDLELPKHFSYYLLLLILSGKRLGESALARYVLSGLVRLLLRA
jgi:hypothetical protein